jgi:hypothetical protein
MSKKLNHNQPSLNTGLAIAIGEFKDTQAINKFGYNAAVGSSAWETVWDGNNEYTYIETAGTAVVTSDDSDDNGGTVLVSDLDANYDPVEETLTIGGGAGSVEFYRVHRAQMVTANTGNVNQGNITITVDTKTAAKITEQIGQTLMAVYTVPRTKTAYLIQIDAGASKDLEHEIRLVIKHNGGVWNTKSYHTQRGGFNALVFEIPIHIPAESDVEIKTKASATSSVSAGFEFILVDN